MRGEGNHEKRADTDATDPFDPTNKKVLITFGTVHIL